MNENPKFKIIHSPDYYIRRSNEPRISLEDKSFKKKLEILEIYERIVVTLKMKKKFSRKIEKIFVGKYLANAGNNPEIKGLVFNKLEDLKISSGLKVLLKTYLFLRLRFSKLAKLDLLHLTGQ